MWRDLLLRQRSGNTKRGLRVRISQLSATKKIIASVSVPANEQSADCIFMLSDRSVFPEAPSMDIGIL